MKEKEFLRKLMSLRKLKSLSIEIPIYYGLDENNNVVVDFDSIREEFEEKIRLLEELE